MNLRLPALSRLAVTWLLLTIGSAQGVVAQSGLEVDPSSPIRTRVELEQLLDLYGQVLSSPAYSDDVKQTTRLRADRIRSRLEEGDFKLGDAVAISVEGEVNLPDTVAVRSGTNGPVIVLPVFGEITLRGVLRSEIEDRIVTALSQFIRDPVVRAEGLMRISIQGAVGRPGFFTVPANMLLSEALMVAGGPAPNANLDGLRVERGVDEILGGTDLQEQLRQGRTLDQLNLQAGDQLVLPADQGGFLRRVPVIMGILTSLTLVIVQISR